MSPSCYVLGTISSGQIPSGVTSDVFHGVLPSHLADPTPCAPTPALTVHLDSVLLPPPPSVTKRRAGHMGISSWAMTDETLTHTLSYDSNVGHLLSLFFPSFGTEPSLTPDSLSGFES